MKMHLSKVGAYAFFVPVILLALTMLLFISAGLILNVWADGWIAIVLLLALCTETFFLPYILMPFAVWLPTLLPWVKYNFNDKLELDGESRLTWGTLLCAMILLPGLPVLSAYDSEVAALAAETWWAPLEILVQGGIGTIAVFIVMACALAIPGVGFEELDS